MAEHKETSVNGIHDEELYLGEALRRADTPVWGKDTIAKKRVKPSTVTSSEAIKLLETALGKDRKVGEAE
jgi:hypothetical protein